MRRNTTRKTLDNRQLSLAAAFCFCLVGTTVRADTYWISTAGRASWEQCRGEDPLSGTGACSIPAANASARAGDLVLLRGGTYSGENVAIAPRNSGNGVNAFITFRAYDDEDVTFTGEGTTSNGAESNSLVDLTGSRYVWIEGITFDHPSRRWATINGYGTSAEYIVFKGCHFTGFSASTWNPFFIRELDHGYFEGGSVDCGDFDFYDDCIIVRDSSSLLWHRWHFGSASHDTYAVRECRDRSFHAFVDCIVENKVHTGLRVGANKYDHGPGNYNLFQGNIFRNSGTNKNPRFSGHDEDGFEPPLYLSSKYNIVRNNLFYDNNVGMLFRFSPDEEKPWEDFSWNYIYNNTIAQIHDIVSDGVEPDGSVGSLLFAQGSYGFDFRYNQMFNNIFWDGANKYGWLLSINAYDDRGSIIADNEISHNIIGDPDREPAIRWQKSTISGMAAINGISDFHDNFNKDPLFANPDVNDFRLTEDSPALDKGRAVSWVASTDSGSGTLLRVNAATGFYAMRTWGHEWIVLAGAASDLASDTIKIGDTAPVRLIAIDYASHTLTLEGSRERKPGDPVYFCFRDQCFSGSKPDLGALELDPIPAVSSDGGGGADGGSNPLGDGHGDEEKTGHGDGDATTTSDEAGGYEDDHQDDAEDPVNLPTTIQGWACAQGTPNLGVVLGLSLSCFLLRPRRSRRNAGRPRVKTPT